MPWFKQHVCRCSCDQCLLKYVITNTNIQRIPITIMFKIAKYSFNLNGGFEEVFQEEPEVLYS